MPYWTDATSRKLTNMANTEGCATSRTGKVTLANWSSLLDSRARRLDNLVRHQGVLRDLRILVPVWALCYGNVTASLTNDTFVVIRFERTRPYN